jgi:hypothetical protein
VRGCGRVGVDCERCPGVRGVCEIGVRREKGEGSSQGVCSCEYECVWMPSAASHTNPKKCILVDGGLLPCSSPYAAG